MSAPLEVTNAQQAMPGGDSIRKRHTPLKGEKGEKKKKKKRKMVMKIVMITLKMIMMMMRAL